LLDLDAGSADLAFLIAYEPKHDEKKTPWFAVKAYDWLGSQAVARYL